MPLDCLVPMHKYNHSQLRDLRKPFVIVKAEHTSSREAHKASYEDADNLDQTVFLAIGARIRLTQNLWVEQG
jgi:protein tyrosine/serine phosphatase